MVKRWHLVNECPNCIMDVNGGGAFILYTEHALLEARCEAAEKERDALRAKLGAAWKWLETNQPDVFRRGLWDAVK